MRKMRDCPLFSERKWGAVPVFSVFERNLVPTGRALPQAGKPRLHGKPPPLPVVIFLHLRRNGRAGADQAHLAEHDEPHTRGHKIDDVDIALQ